jgi:hypothetical protein
VDGVGEATVALGRGGMRSIPRRTVSKGMRISCQFLVLD